MRALYKSAMSQMACAQGWVFPVQNLFFPVQKWDKLGKTCFSQFFSSKTGKDCPKPGKIMQDYISSQKVSKNVIYQIKI